MIDFKKFNKISIFNASVIQGIESWISNPIMSVRIAPEVLLKIVKNLRVSLKNPT